MTGHALSLAASSSTDFVELHATDPGVQNLGTTHFHARSIWNEKLGTVIFLRMQNSGSGYWQPGGFCNNGYLFEVHYYQGYNLFKWVNGAVVGLGLTTYTYPTLTYGQAIDVDAWAVGNQLSLYINGTEIVSATDSSFSSGAVGIASRDAGLWDDIKINPVDCDWTATGTATPTVSQTTTPSPTLTPSFTVSPTVTMTISGCTGGCNAVYCNDFESQTIGAAPTGWDVAYTSSGSATVVDGSSQGMTGHALRLTASSTSDFVELHATDPGVQNLGVTHFHARSIYNEKLGTLMFLRMQNGGGRLLAGRLLQQRVRLCGELLPSLQHLQDGQWHGDRLWAECLPLSPADLWPGHRRGCLGCGEPALTVCQRDKDCGWDRFHVQLRGGGHHIAGSGFVG